MFQSSPGLCSLVLLTATDIWSSPGDLHPATSRCFHSPTHLNHIQLHRCQVTNNLCHSGVSEKRCIQLIQRKSSPGLDLGASESFTEMSTIDLNWPVFSFKHLWFKNSFSSIRERTLCKEVTGLLSHNSLQCRSCYCEKKTGKVF